MSARIERLEAELALATLEEELSAAKGKGKRPKPIPDELNDRVRAARLAFREKYREQVNVNPASIGAGATIPTATASTD